MAYHYANISKFPKKFVLSHRWVIHITLFIESKIIQTYLDISFEQNNKTFEDFIYNPGCISGSSGK